MINNFEINFETYFTRNFVRYYLQSLFLSTAVTERIETPSLSTTITTSTVTVTTSSNCAVCNIAGATRTVSRSRAIHYGLKEDAEGARVCEPCHCRCVRSRYTRCPVPTCPGPRVRAKRLRHLPPRWHDLSLELKRPLMDEFGKIFQCICSVIKNSFKINQKESKCELA